MSEMKCVWNLGTPCVGKVKEVEFFDKQIKIPVCKSHVEDHSHIMILHKNNYDVEEILQQTSEYRKKEVLMLQLSGLEQGEIAL